MRRTTVRFVISALAAASISVPAVQVLSQSSASAVTNGSVGAAAASSWQSNATVWKMAYANGDIWLVGDFTTLRPPGAAAGTSEQPANYFAALKASTGAPDTNVNATHTFTGQSSGLPLTNGYVAASPDGKTVYVGGGFNAVDGVTRHHIAAFSATTGALLPWNPNVSGQVSAIATSGNVVYVGGTFGKVGNVAAGPNLAAIDATTGKLLNWGSGVQPSTDANVDALAVSTDGSQVIAGGYFDMVDGLTQSADGTTPYNKAVIIGGVGSAQAGQLEPMTADTVVPVGTAQHNTGCYSNVKNITVAGNSVYLADEGTGGGCFDGTWAVNLPDGTLKWVNRCLGGTQIVAVVGNYLYKGSHAHDCQSRNVNGDPDNFPQVITNESRHLLSENLSNGFLGPWYPFSNAGPNLGPRAMATDGTQLYVGGDFTTMNHKGQEGIARFTPTSDYATPRPDQPVAVSSSAGSVNVFAQAPVDLDSPDLTLQLFRDGGSTPIGSQQVHSLFWKQPVVGFTDSGLAAGSSHTYRVRAIETNGNGALSTASPVSGSVTVSNGSTGYAATVLSQNPAAYWRLGEASGSTVAADSSPNLDGGAYTGTVTLGAAGGVGDADTAATFDGATGYFSSGHAEPSPTTFSVDAWIKTTTASGGKIIGFGNSQIGNSSSYDKQLYMTNTGKLVFGCYTGATVTITSSKSYNDGNWHQVVGTQGPNGMALYVDGVKVGSNSNTVNQSYNGFWRIGEDNLASWPSRPTSNFFNGTIDDASVYHAALTPGQIAAQYTAAGGSLPTPPGSTTPYAKNVLGDNPTTYWRFDESSGTTALDISGNGDNATYGSAVSKGVSGAISDGVADTAVATNGLLNNNGRIVGQLQLPSPTTFSLEGWFKTSSAAGKIIGFGDSATTANSTNYDKHVYFDNGVLNFGVWNGEEDIISSGTGLANGQWHHFVASQDGSGMKLYVDGGLVASNAVTTNQSYNGYWHVGGDAGWGATANFTGSLDEVAVYPYALSASQVQSDYNIGTGASSTPTPPGPPTGVQATSSSPTTADISWTTDPGATSYQVQRSDHGANSFSNVGSPTGTTSLHDTGLTPGASYDYQVIASNAGGPSSPSVAATVTTLPGAPGTLTAVANGTNEIDLSWGAATGATSYDVQRGPAGSGTFPTDLGATAATTFPDTGLNPGDSFDYRVVPSDSTGPGAPSNTATGTTTPAQVTGLTATPSGTAIGLSWNAAAGASTYTVQRAPHGSVSFTTIASGGTATSYNDTGLAPATTYDYRVRALNAGGSGDFSATQSATTAAVVGNPALRSNSFEGGSAGAAITAANSGGSSGDKFDAVTCSGGNPTYSSTAAHGSLGAALGVGTSTCFLQWGPSSIATTTTSYGRLYLYLPSNPGASTILAKLGTSTFGRDAQINLSSTGKLSLVDANNTKQATFTSAVPLGSWVRLEWSLTNSTTTGSFSVSMFNGDTTSPIETQSATNINTGASFGSAQVGSVIATSTPVGTIGLDDVAYGTAGPLGPAS